MSALLRHVACANKQAQDAAVAVPTGCERQCCFAGLRVLKPGAKWWPSWADCYNNLRWVPQIQCPLIVLHVRPALTLRMPVTHP